MRWIAFVLAISNTLWPNQAQAQSSVVPSITPSLATPIIYELRLPGVGAVTVVGYDAGSDILLPIESILELAGLHFKVDYTHKTVQFDRTLIPISGLRNHPSPDSAYSFLSTITRSLKITARLDREEATIIFANTEHLPAVRQLRRAAARAVFNRSKLPETLTPPIPVESPSPRMGSVALDYALYQQRARDASSRSYSLSAATPVASGNLITRLSGSSNNAQLDLAWLGVWPLGHEPTQLRFGSGTSSGLGTVPIRGAYVSNAPWVRVRSFDRLSVAGALPPDWSVEVYRDGVLVGYDSVGTGGQYQLPVPVHYGENALKLIAYGPGGEIVHFDRMIRARPSMLPTGAFEFAASTGACATQPCSWMMNMDFRYGLSPQWSLRGGATEYSWRNGAPTDVYPYISLDGILRPGLSAGVERLHRAYTKVGVAWDPSLAFSVIGDYTVYNKSQLGAYLSGSTSSQLWIVSRFAPASLPIPIEAQLMRVQDRFGTHSFLRTGSSFVLNNATIRPYVRYMDMPSTNTTSLGFDATATGAAFKVNALRMWWMRSAFEINTDGALQNAEATIARSAIRGLAAEAGLRWNGRSNRPQISIGLTTEIGQIRTQSYSQTSLNGDLITANQSFSGSLRWDADTKRLLRSSNSILERAGLSGVVFLDENGNGRFDEGEQLLRNVNVQVGATVIRTNNAGYYEAWGIPAGQVVCVKIDISLLESPWWVPVDEQRCVSTMPNSALPFNVAVVEGGILEGAVISSDSNSINAVGSIKITHAATGRVYTVEPFSDGTFYLMGLLPGSYFVGEKNDSGKQLRMFNVTPNTTTTFDLVAPTQKP